MDIKKTQWEGFDAIEILTPKARMVVVAEVGPRIAFFGRPKGRNLLYWNKEQDKHRKDWYLRGGHRIWTTRPGADECEETYMSDNRPCKVRKVSKGISLLAPVDEAFQIQKQLTVKVKDDATFEVENRVINTSNLIWSGGVWGLTCTDPSKATTYGIPVGDGSGWDNFNMVFFKAWAGAQTSRVDDPQVQYAPNCIVVKPKGIEAKRMIQSAQGIIGLTDTDEKLSFIKKVPYISGATYPLNTNIAFYVAEKNFMVEMECMGPETTLNPGAQKVLPETWALRDPVDWAGLDAKPMKI